MQLMTFNSLLMFDIVFVFFLFLVGVTCLVYYLPTGGGGASKQHNQSHSHSQHHHDHESAGESVNCRYERHKFHLCPHHRLTQLHQLRYNPQSADIDTEGTETETESEATCYPDRIRNQDREREIPEHLLTPLRPCRCSLSAGCSVCTYPVNREGDCVLTLDEEGAASSSTVDLRLLERHPTPHHRYCHRHSIQTDRCLHYIEDDDPDNDSSDDIFYCNEDNSSAMGVSSFGEILGSVAPSVSPIFEHVVINETENGVASPCSASHTAPQCCYIKAKFMDVKECVGPIADV
ncbi:unnamed protein product [Hermetia illucens]|uniref:Uncharacterized protein n=1 Tax=Hermetia illucens TaxID=343691 RepID=A0A7R8UBT0_HERIL|nr:unnamed protein product [Hermetia illucens]